MNSTKGLGEELSRVCLESAARENATYADFRLVNTVTEVVSVINENPATEELNDLGAGIRVLYKDSGWGFADTDEVNPENIRETTRKALSLARGAAKIGSKISFVKEPVHVDDWVSPKKKDPLAVSLDEKYGLLQDATERMREILRQLGRLQDLPRPDADRRVIDRRLESAIRHPEEICTAVCARWL